MAKLSEDKSLEISPSWMVRERSKKEIQSEEARRNLKRLEDGIDEGDVYPYYVKVIRNKEKVDVDLDKLLTSEKEDLFRRAERTQIILDIDFQKGEITPEGYDYICKEIEKQKKILRQRLDELDFQKKK